VLTDTTQEVFALGWRGGPNRREIPAAQPHVGVDAPLGVVVEVKERLVPQVEVGAIALATSYIYERIDCMKRFDQLCMCHPATFNLGSPPCRKRWARPRALTIPRIGSRFWFSAAL
jgi:hypothetical protein